MTDNIIKLLDAALADNPFTEDALALRFSEQQKDGLRYIALKGVWLHWDGGRWCIEATLPRLRSRAPELPSGG